MLEVKICGRGGEGIVTAAELLAIAGFKEGKYTQAFPFFGVERRGSPVESYVRMDDKIIKTRERVYNPNIIIIVDDSLITGKDTILSSKEDLIILINSKKNDILKDQKNVHIINVGNICDEKEVKMRNVAMLGFFSKVTKIVSLDSLKKAVQEKFPREVAERNIKVLEKAYEMS